MNLPLKTTDIRLVWTTDIHLNFLNPAQIHRFCKELLSENPDLIVVTGDLSEAPLLSNHLLSMEKHLEPIPLFFVCGNHDYYNGSIHTIRDTLKNGYTYPEVDKNLGKLTAGTWWLGSSGYIPVTKTSALIGHDGWYDGLYADYFKSRIDMSDYYIIRELTGGPFRRLAKIQELATASADYIEAEMRKAFADGFKVVYVATHVPPFRENAVYKDKISDDHWMPHFSSKIMGDRLIKVMKEFPDKTCMTLCGHSHGNAYHKPLPNLECRTGEAEYRYPAINDIFIIE